MGGPAAWGCVTGRGDAQLRALRGQLAPRHRPGQRLRWRPPFPLARPRPAGLESEPGSEILPPHSLGSFSQTLRIALQTLLAPCPSEPSFIQRGCLQHRPWMGSALSREDRAANKIPPTTAKTACPHGATLQEERDPTPDHHKTPCGPEGRGLPDCFRLKGTAQKHTGRVEAALPGSPDGVYASSQ